jgi:ArsR family transcriptional regulator
MSATSTRATPDLASVFRALGDPSRLAIFRLVCERGAEVRTAEDARNSVSTLAREFDLSLSTVSHHLRELRNAGLIRCERRGKTVLCSPVPEALETIESFAADAVARPAREEAPRVSR